MAAPTIAWPEKTHEIRNVIMDSIRWDGFPFRDDDIVITTWGKSGTTWTQQIVGQLVRCGAEMSTMAISPWLDAAPRPLKEVLDLLEAQTHRRFIKSHLPLDALVFSPKAKYIYVGRDGRDSLWSWHNHYASFTDQAYEMINNAPGRIGPPVERCPEDVVEYFRLWLDDRDHSQLPDFWSHYQGWFDARRLPNVLLVHFNHLKADLPGEMRRIAGFLGIEIEESLWPTLIEHCTFDYMKKTATKHPILQAAFKNGSNDFFHSGTNGRWRDLLTADDLANYDRKVKEKLTPECARWMATGELP